MQRTSVDRGGRSSWRWFGRGAVTLLGMAAAASCSKPTQRPVIAVPAARAQGEGRPLLLMPPFQLARAQDAIVRLVVDDITCSGTLIAEDLVLTAHHCVAARDGDDRIQSYDREPSDISVELGGDHMPWGHVSVRAIVTPDCGYASGDGDIAILVLSRRLIGVATMVPRLEKGPARGEELTPWGFGRCASSASPVHLAARNGGSVKMVHDGQFTAPVAICPGDSGGPALSHTDNTVVGVVSASVMDADEKTVAPSFFTRLDPWRPLFAAAREIADGASPSELPPFRSCVW